MTQSPESIFSSQLGPDERLLWAGRPRTRIRFRPQDSFLIPFSLLWAGFAIFWELMALLGTSKAPGPVRFAFPLVGAAFVLVGLYMVIGRFLVDARARALTVYGVTNQRILILGGFRSRETKSLQLRTIPELSMTEREDGSGTIAFGPAVPNAGYLPVLFSPSSGQMLSPSFEFIDRVRDIYKIIRTAQQAASSAG